ncbi:MAG: hemolysin family protein [Dehalococcoidia bacterium]|nr:hemolysin family protein [Dehalococcoidia bacterium]
MSDLWQLGLVAALILLNAVFAGSEMALISLRPTQIDRVARRGRSGRTLGRLTADPNRFLATIQIGITLAGFLASAAAAVSLAGPVAPLFSAFGAAADLLAIFSVTLVLTFVTLVLGELAPKRIAMQHAEGWALLVARPLDLLARVARPAVWLLSLSTNAVVRLAGGDPSRQREEVTEEEIRDMVAAQGSLTPEERQVIAGALEVGERSLRQVLVPRQAIFALPADTPVAEALPQVLASGHSRVPIYRTTLDTAFAAVHLRQLIGQEGTLADLGTPILSFPESAAVLAALRTMQRERQQIALVVDEHGGVEGLVTTEDLVEEIVGEIYDEDDRDVIGAIRLPGGGFELPGSFPVHDLVDLGIEAQAGPYTTVAGIILDRLGRIPAAGDHVDIGSWRFTAMEVHQSRITRVHLREEPANASSAPDRD